MARALGSELGGRREVHTEFNVHMLLKSEIWGGMETQNISPRAYTCHHTSACPTYLLSEAKLMPAGNPSLPECSSNDPQLTHSL